MRWSTSAAKRDSCGSGRSSSGAIINMCGIAVHLSSSGRATPLDLHLLRHRGPDSSGQCSAADGRCWLGCTRLAIVDLSPTGAQPMIDPASGNVIVMNGEIYNHRALRDSLGPNVNWSGTSDTETLLHGYARWRHGVLDRIKGMFAFAIYDNAREELFLGRDRLGIKPLYYTLDAHGVRLASEVKALAGAGEAITAESISAYLQWGACPEKNLLYSNIHSLPAGHAMTIARQGQREMWRYWPSRQAFVSSSDQVVRQVRGLINKAVEEHLLSDVPIASFLSGGIDSSIVTAIAAQKLERRLQTFSVAFDLAEFDESAIALEIARRYRTEHHRIQLSEEEVIHSVTEAVDKLDLPSVDAINTYIVSRAVAKHGVKVALSGLGGDELFGGYASFRDAPRLKLISKLPRPLRRIMGATGNFGER
jgi:asparagine synthase (glutamine-hydrolysing)